MISTEPIGPVVCPRNPVLVKSPMRASESPTTRGKVEWEAELATVSRYGRTTTTVWRSSPVRGDNRVRVDEKSGEFLATLRGERRLAPNATYRTRARQRTGTGRSQWHQTFHTNE